MADSAKGAGVTKLTHGFLYKAHLKMSLLQALILTWILGSASKRVL